MFFIVCESKTRTNEKHAKHKTKIKTERQKHET